MADSPGGIPFVNCSPHLSPSCSLSLVSGILTRMGMSAEVSCSVASVDFRLREHQDEIGGRRLGKKVAEGIP